MPGTKRAFALLSALTLMALPVSAALHKTPPAYGKVILTVESHFSLGDRNSDGLMDKQEYIAVSHKLKQQSKVEAGEDFAAMDINGDGQLDFDEFYGELPSDLTV